MNNKNTAELRFSSFDGGGPEYKVLIDDESVLTAELTREYYSPNHAEQCGSGYSGRGNAPRLFTLFHLNVNQIIKYSPRVVEGVDPYNFYCPSACASNHNS
ncbi:MAG: hypothetical protein IKN26_00420 [Eubacterium sp.]|nr:hypothetical protein [Eubacterium sp.]